MAQLPSALRVPRGRGRPATRSPVRCTAKSMMVVVPPQAAARVPVSNVSEAKVPPKGSSMWVWTSTPPGRRTCRWRRSSRVGVVAQRRSSPARPAAAMRSPSTSTSLGIAPVALTTVPFVIRIAMTASPISCDGCGQDDRGLRSASSSVTLSGGAMRSTLPYRPPLPTEQAPPRASPPAARRRPGRLGPPPLLGAGRRTSSTASIRPVPAHLGRRTGGGRPALARRSQSTWPILRALPCRSWSAGSRGWPARRRTPAGCRRRWRCELARRGSPCTSARATTPPRDRPLPTPLAKVSMSGTMPWAW